MAQAGLGDLLSKIGGAGGGGGGEDAPRQNKTIKQYQGMNTQNERNAIPEGQFHWLENIQPIGPGNLHSIPGRALAGVEIPQPTPPPPEECTDATERGQQSLAVELAFDQTTIAGNLRTSWAYINNGELVSMVGEANCAGGNMAYNAGALPPPPYFCVAQAHYPFDTGVGPDAFAQVIDPDSLVPAINTRMGNGDQPAYGFITNAVNGLSVSYPDENVRVVYQFAPNFAGGASHNDVWGFRDTQLYSQDYDGTDAKARLLEYDRASGNLTGSVKLWGTDNIIFRAINVTADRIIALVTNNTEGSDKLFFIKRSDLTLDTTRDITRIGAFYMFAVNNSLQYLLTAACLYYYGASGLVYVGKPSNSIPTSAFSAEGFFHDGKMYFGGDGFGGFSVDVFKIAVACPEGSPPQPKVASISTGSTVAAGSAINVSWADILEPDLTDKIQFRQEFPGFLGFNGATSPQQSTGGMASGTISFTIPGGTPPGTYRFQLVTNNGTNFIARSNTFTVT